MKEEGWIEDDKIDSLIQRLQVSSFSEKDMIERVLQEHLDNDDTSGESEAGGGSVLAGAGEVAGGVDVAAAGEVSGQEVAAGGDYAS